MFLRKSGQIKRVNVKINTDVACLVLLSKIPVQGYCFFPVCPCVPESLTYPHTCLLCFLHTSSVYLQRAVYLFHCQIINCPFTFSALDLAILIAVSFWPGCDSNMWSSLFFTMAAWVSSWQPVSDLCLYSDTYLLLSHSDSGTLELMSDSVLAL